MFAITGAAASDTEAWFNTQCPWYNEHSMKKLHLSNKLYFFLVFKNIKLLYSTWPEVEPVLESFGWFLAGSSNNYKTSKKNAMMVCLECDVLAKIIDIHRQIKMIDKVQRADNTSLVWCLLIMNHILLLNYSFNVFLTDREIKVASVVNAKKFPLLCLCSFKDK